MGDGGRKVEMGGEGGWVGRGEGGGGMQRSLDDFAVAPPHNSSVASIHGVPRERVRTRREPGGKLSNSNPHPKDKISF